MTQIPTTLPPHEQETVTIFRDRYGNEVLRTGMKVVSAQLPDGTFTEQKISEDIETVDHFSWNAALRYTQNPVHLTICAACRATRASHGLCTTANIKRCVVCEAHCCPSHARLCADQKYRCLKCAWWFRLKSLLLWLFSAPVKS